MNEENLEFIQEFIDEARGHIEDIEEGLMELSGSGSNSEIINNIFRALHSIKGTAGFFELNNISKLAHVMEDLFGEIRSDIRPCTDEIIDASLAANDILKNMTEDAINSDSYNVESQMSIIKEILKSSPKAEPADDLDDIETEADSPPDTAADDISSLTIGVSDEKPDTGAAAIEEKQDDHDIKNDDENDESDDENEAPDTKKPAVADNKTEKDTGPAAGKPPAQTDQSGKTFVAEDSIRVHVSVLNSLLDMAGEMVLGRNQLLRTLEDYKKDIPGLPALLQNIDRLTSDIQKKIMQTRMQPIGNVFNKFPRIIRDLSKKLNKEIVLKLEGIDVELDKSVIEALADPLTHLVRNSADHGLETTAERTAAGKHGQGMILLNAYHEGGYVNIDIADDGAGINTDRVKENAISKGLVSEKDADDLSEQEIFNMIFKPGFSTTSEVSSLSGRGVGMDVVKTNIEKIGGSIEIISERGQGTTVRLVIPLTLAIIQSLILEVEGQRFALPRVNVQEIVRIKKDDTLRQIEYIHNAEVLRLRGRLLPIVHLADVLGIQRTFIDPETGERKKEKRRTFVDLRTVDDDIEDDNDDERRYRYNFDVLRILVLKVGSKRFGIAVDTIFGSEETLVKPLPIYLNSCISYSGVTIMGDGKAAMILDADGIIKNSSLKYKDEELDKLTSAEDELEEEYQNLLLFKCSGEEVFALDIAMIARVYKIEANEVERIGGKEYIQYNGESLRVIRPEDFITVGKGDGDSEELHVIIPKLVSYPMGILIEQIFTSINIAVRLNTEDIKLDCITGSAIINNRITLLLNIYELFEKAAPEHYQVSIVKNAKKINVLLAEDSSFFLKTVTEYLETAGFRVITAKNGQEALELLTIHDIHAVVSDINMPIMDGIELVKAIRRNTSFCDLPVIALTSMTGDEQKQAGLNAGFDYYKFKLDRATLIDTIIEAIKEKELV